MTLKLKGKHGGARCRSGKQIPPEAKLTPTGITVPIGEWQAFVAIVPDREVRQQLFLGWIRQHTAEALSRAVGD